jgi:hypothetical protein
MSKSRKTDSNPKSKLVREDVVSWVLHSIKAVMGYEDIRQDVLKAFHPSLPNIEHARTFDAHIAYTTKASYTKNYKKKVNEILTYCQSMVDLEGTVVFTATNLEEYRDNTQEKDNETHYQMFLIDHDHRTLYTIDPALKRNQRPGIYVPQVAIDIIQPWFKKHHYTTKYVKLSNPAQTDNSADNADIFCQTWSMYILLDVLKQREDTTSADTFSGIVVDIPEDQSKRYQILLKFYKDILKRVPSVGRALNPEYVSELKLYKPDGYQWMIKENAHDVALTLRSSEMHNA